MFCVLAIYIERSILSFSFLEGGQGNKVAYSAHCQEESDGPIAGHMNICPFALNFTQDKVKTIWAS